MVKRVLLPSIDRLNELFSYEPETGYLKWKVRRQGVNADLIAGVTHHGYVVIRVDGTLYQAHRIIWKIVTGNEPPDFIDHMDCDRSHNAWVNLRAASNSKNMMNAKINKQNTSGLKGVCWHARGQKWMASVMLNGSGHYLGLHETREQAASAVAMARERLHGEFARFT